MRQRSYKLEPWLVLLPALVSFGASFWGLVEWLGHHVRGRVLLDRLSDEMYGYLAYNQPVKLAEQGRIMGTNAATMPESTDHKCCNDDSYRRPHRRYNS